MVTTGEIVSAPGESAGFAGECSVGRNWKYVSRDSEWRCSGEPSWTQGVILLTTTKVAAAEKGTIGLITPRSIGKGLHPALYWMPA